MKPEFRLLPVAKDAIRQQVWLEPQHLNTWLKRVVAIAFLCLPWQVNAIGLGVPLHSPVLLQALRIDIPLLVGADETLPRNDCVHIAPAADGTDLQFFPKQAKLSVEATPTPHLRITSPVAVREPFLEFRLVLGCNGPMSRDYLLLTRHNDSAEELNTTRVPANAAPAHPADAAQQPSMDAKVVAGSGTIQPAAPRIADLSAKIAVANQPPSAGNQLPPSKNQLTLKRDSTLNAMARVRYPGNQSTRDEYRRLMALANPSVFGDASQVGSVFLPAGTVLSIPANLPPLELEASQSATSSPLVSSPRPVTKPATGKTAQGSSGRQMVTKDRLVIGGANEISARRPMSAKEAAETIERLDQMLTAQTTSERELAEKLKSLEALFTSTKSQLQFLEAKSKQQEADQRLLQGKLDVRPEPRSLGFLELMILVVTCGVIGAGLLAYSHRQRRQGAGFLGADADRNLSTLEPHPIFTTGSEAPEMDFDAEIVPVSKSVSPSSARSELPWLSSGSKSTPVPAAAAVASPHQPAKSSDSVRVSPVESKPIAAESPRAKVQENSNRTAASTAPETLPEATSSHPSDMEFPANTSKRNSDFVEAKKAPASPPPVPEIAFSLDLDSLSTPKRPAPLSDLAYPAGGEAAKPLDASLPSVPEVAMPFDLAWRTDAEIEAAAAQERKLAAKPQMPVAKTESLKSAEDPAVELADIMISMGMDDHAERTLIDYILEDPKRDLGPWLKALEIYRESNRREEFEELAISLRKNLNVAPDPWESDEPRINQSLEGFPRVNETIQRLWPTEAADAYLGSLLGDNRDGSRAGFPQAVAEEILWLLRILRVRRETA